MDAANEMDAAKEIHPGLFHWKAIHPKIRFEVSSYYLAGSRTVIDPMLPPEGIEWFADHGEPERVLLTNRHHLRQSAEIAGAFGCPILSHEAGLHEFDGDPEVEGFRFGERLAQGVTAVEIGVLCPEETALQIDLGEGFLAFADGLIRYGGELGFVPYDYCYDDPEAEKRGLRRVFRGLLDRRFDSLLFAHGDPLLGGGKEALREFAESDQR